MADVTGPISTLPGYSGWAVPEGTMCDNHNDRKAVVRIQGETDSMGCEMYDLCQECADEDRAARRNEDTSGVCDWCKLKVDKRAPKRDYEEGMHGPVYYVCAPCIKKNNDYWLEQDRLSFDDYPDDDC